MHAAGRLTARERIDALLDAGSFVEVGILAESSPEAPGAGAADGLVCGAGEVDGQPVVVAAVDATVHGGSLSKRSARKVEKALSLSLTHRWPFVLFAEGEGTRTVPDGDREWGSGTRFGIFDVLAELSGWAPTAAAISGNCLAVNAAMALFCDFVVGTKGSALGLRDGGREGLSLLEVEAHEAMGDIDLLVEDDAAAADAIRRYLSFMVDLADGAPADNARAVADIVPENRKRAYDMRKIIAAVADKGSVLELRPNFAKSMLTVFARLDGRAVGIFANQPMSSDGGAIDPLAADKLSRFVELCNAYELPMVSFIDNPGYMVGPKSEQAGIARHHARPLSALHHRTVPVYSVQVRKAYGLGPFAMYGYGSSRLIPDLKLAWPSVESGGMSLEGAAFLVRRKEIMAAKTPEEAKAIRDDYASTVRDLRSGLRAGRTFQFDDIIEPGETRDRIIAMLRRTPRSSAPAKKHYIDPI
jgi:acetyl-CoA carboxylase carboxyltransferase component